MLDTSAKNEAVASGGLEGLVAAAETEAAFDDVHHLIVRVGMPGARPPILHLVLDQHHAGIVRKDSPQKAGLGGEKVGRGRLDPHEVRECVSCGIHVKILLTKLPAKAHAG